MGYFRKLLSEKCEQGDLVDNEAQTQRQVEAVSFLLDRAGDS